MMIDVETLWTSESVVENLNTLIDEFFNVACNAPAHSLEETLNMKAKSMFAFNCVRCGKNHIVHGSEWSVVASTMTMNVPSEDHPEFDEYVARRKEINKDMKHLDIRDVAEPFIKETPEWEYVEGALQEQQDIIADFLNNLCKSKVTLLSHPQLNTVVEVYCKEHQAHHYATPQQYNSFVSRINGAHVSEKFVGKLSPLAQRIVLRDTSAVWREFKTKHPAKNVESVAFQNRLMEKALQKAANISEAKMQKQAKKTAKKKACVETKKTHNVIAKKATSSRNGVADPNLYILKPHLMSEDWLIEYHVCGRKVAYEKVSEALIFKHTQLGGGGGGYTAYECSYCGGWHLGHKRKKDTLTKAHQARRGLYWYKRNHKKANAFIHKIMMEEF